MKNTGRAWFLRMLLALVALGGLAYWTASTRDQFELTVQRAEHVRLPFHFNEDTGEVTGLQPEADRAGIPTGARIRTLNGAPYTGGWQWDNALDEARPGDSVLVGFTAGEGAPHTVQVTLAPLEPVPGLPATRSRAWQGLLVYNLAPLLCMLIGYWVVFVKPEEPNAWLLLVLLVYPSIIFSVPTGLASGGWLALRREYSDIFQSFAPLAILLFALYFPERSRVDQRVPWLKWTVLGPAFAAACLDLRQRYGAFFEGGNAAWLRRIEHPAWVLENTLDLLCVALYFVVLIDKLRTAFTADARRRLRVLLAGTSVGIGAVLLVYALLPALGYRQYLDRHQWVRYLGALFFMLAPLTLAYVVLVQRAMDVRVLLRQGTRYAVARASLWIVQAAVITVLIVELLPSRSGQHSAALSTVQIVSFIAILVTLRLLVRKRAATWIDRKFFREAYDAELLLNELAEEVHAYTDSGPLLETVSRRVADTLHVRSIAMLRRDGTSYCVAQSLGVPQEGASMSLALGSSSVRKLTNERQPLHLYRSDPDAWYMLAGQSEQQTLDQLGAELLLPLPGRSGLMGIMILGPKQSEAAFSKSDLKLLQAVATQTGLALEVGELAHSLATAAAQRERALRELELAREVQERLFPQSMPEFAAGSVAGACRPAQSVGGDYYDVFRLDDGRFGIAIGDVSGKGISAALLMAGLRASIRGIADQTDGGFGALMGKVNRLVCEASASNRFATLFFAMFDPVTGALECVNAGHNPPLLLRTRGGVQQAEWLAADGPVVGILEGAAYAAKKLFLAPGDVLVAYTDGVSEAMTHADEEWGEERLLAAAWRSCRGRAGDVVASVFTDADSFTAGAPQHDDMTMLVLKLEPLPVV